MHLGLIFKQPILIGIYIFIAVYIAAALIPLSLNHYFDATRILTAALIAIIITIVNVIILCKRINRDLKRFKGTDNNNLSIKHYQVSDKIYSINESNEKIVSFDFKEIIHFNVAKNYIILSTTKKAALVFKKDAFTVGTFEEFKAFLRVQYPLYKI